MSRRSSVVERPLIVALSMRMSPLVRSIIRFTRRMAVVLPQPDGPTSTHTSPAGTVNERLSIADVSAWGYCFVTFTNSSGAAVLEPFIAMMVHRISSCCLEPPSGSGGGNSKGDVGQGQRWRPHPGLRDTSVIFGEQAADPAGCGGYRSPPSSSSRL